MKTHTTFFFKAIFIFFIAAYSYAQTPKLEWIQSAGNTGNDNGNSIAKDSSGNMYIVGSFATSISFGKDTVISSSGKDIFIAKFDPDGNNLWTKSQGGKNYLYFVEIINSCADKYGNLYITGNFRCDSLTFGSFTLYNVGNSENIFIVKYNPEGNVLWARSAGGKDNDGSTSIATDNEGNVFLGGYFSSDSITFGSKTLKNSSPTKDYDTEFFIVKYDTEGNVIWANSAIGNSSKVNTIVTDKQGSVYALGIFSGTILKLNTSITLSAPIGSNQNLFLVKYDANGNVLWGKPFVSNGGSISSNLTIDNNNNLYLVGKHTHSITFDTVKLGTNIFMYIAKYDFNGNMIWAKTDTEGTGNCTALLTDNSGNLYMAGDFITQITFRDTTLYNYGGKDIFLAKYDKNGEAQWAKSMGGIKEDVCNGIILNQRNSLYLLGTFISPELFIESTVLKNYDSLSSNIVFAKLNGVVTGINDESTVLTSPVIFQNPVQGSFTVSVPEGNWHIRVYSLEGIPVSYTTMADSEIVIDLSGQPKGIYIYQLQKDNVIVKTGKLILE